MPRGRKPRTWVRMDCEGLLRGSINYLLPLDGQAVWLKMIALSELCGGRPGFIEDNNNKGLPHEYIAQELHCSLELFELVLEKMGGDSAIKIHMSGTIELVNFNHYQFSEYDRQKPYRLNKKLREKDPQDGFNQQALLHMITKKIFSETGKRPDPSEVNHKLQQYREEGKTHQQVKELEGL